MRPGEHESRLRLPGWAAFCVKCVRMIPLWMCMAWPYASTSGGISMSHSCSTETARKTVLAACSWPLYGRSTATAPGCSRKLLQRQSGHHMSRPSGRPRWLEGEHSKQLVLALALRILEGVSLSSGCFQVQARWAGSNAPMLTPPRHITQTMSCATSSQLWRLVLACGAQTVKHTCMQPAISQQHLLSLVNMFASAQRASCRSPWPIFPGHPRACWRSQGSLPGAWHQLLRNEY